jgi:signal transduction histidine kinase
MIGEGPGRRFNRFEASISERSSRLGGPRITTGTVPASLEQLAALRSVRYSVPLISVGIAAAVAFFLGRSIESHSRLFVFFCAVLLPAATCGLGPGLVATALCVLARYLVWPSEPNLPEIIVLAAQGILVSIVGGSLRSIKLKAHARLAENLNLEQRLLEIGDDERRRIGHDLHDGLGQHLTGISLLSETMAQQLESGTKPDPRNVETVTRLVSEAVRITRDLAKSLSPVTLERHGLVVAIEELAGTVSTLFSVNCVWESNGYDPPLDRAQALHLFRIVQEAVNNSVRHGKAHNIHVSLNQVGRGLCLRVVDDGSGLSQKTSESPGLGLRIMQYRARMLGAILSVERASEAGGTTVTCTCPIDAPETPN